MIMAGHGSLTATRAILESGTVAPWLLTRISAWTTVRDLILGTGVGGDRAGVDKRARAN
jgi:hypothetical protein